MSYPLIELIDEIHARLLRAKNTLGLEDKDIFIGAFEQDRKDNDYPVVIIAPLSGIVEPECMQHGTFENVEIGIQYIINKKADNNNKLYKDSDSSGALYNLAIILNALEQKTSDGSVDLTVNAKTNSLARTRYNFDYSNSNLIKINIVFSAKTREFTRGTR